MSIYKPSLLDKFKDFVNGLRGNWDQYEDHVADFEAHLAESSSKHITESGSNENGRYIKFDDGTMICWGKSSILTLSFPSSPNWGSLFTTGGDSIPSMPFPVPFVGDIPYVRLDFERISGGNFWIMRSNIKPSLTHSGSGEILRGTSYPDPFTGRATYFAIGRWK